MALRPRISGTAKAIAYDVSYRVPEIQKTAAQHATNYAMRKVYVETLRGISKATGIPQLTLRGSAKKGIKRRVILNKASRKFTRAQVWIGTAPIPLTSTLKNKLSFRRAPSTKLFNQYTTEKNYGKGPADTFAAQMPSGHQGIFVREGRARLPIQEVKIEIHALAAAVVKRAGDQYAQALFDKEFLRLSERAL